MRTACPVAVPRTNRTIQYDTPSTIPWRHNETVVCPQRDPDLPMDELWSTIRPAFLAAEHLPVFHLDGDPAYVLVHGFLGTPAEWRPLIHELRRSRCTFVAPLLPGFGHRLVELPTIRLHDWLTALHEAWRAITPCEVTILVGYSLGGALATILASDTPVRLLVLIAPFSRMPLPLWYRLLRPLLATITPGPRPFARIDFDDPNIQRALAGWNPLLDVRNPRVRAHLQNLRFPWQLLDELDRTAKRAQQAASTIRCPVIVIQGRDDRTVRLHDTRRFVARFRTTLITIEVPGDHQVLRPVSPAFPTIVSVLRDLAPHLATSAG